MGLNDFAIDNGRIIARQSMAKITADIPVRLPLIAENNKLPGGLYFIKVSGSGGEMVTGKVVVE